MKSAVCRSECCGVPHQELSVNCLPSRDSDACGQLRLPTRRNAVLPSLSKVAIATIAVRIFCCRGDRESLTAPFVFPTADAVG